MFKVQPTPKQLHVLANISSIRLHSPQYPDSPLRNRMRKAEYRLDGASCTKQVTSLLVQGLIRRDLNDELSCTDMGRHHQR